MRWGLNLNLLGDLTNVWMLALREGYNEKPRISIDFSIIP